MKQNISSLIAATTRFPWARGRAQLVKAMALATFATSLPASGQVPNVAQTSPSGSAKNSTGSTNTPPVAKVDYVYLSSASKAFNVLANDHDADNDALTVIEASAKHGAVAFTADGLVAYAANPAERGSDEIIYVVADNKGGMAKGKVIVAAK